MIHNIVEQNRRLINRREIKIINNSGQSELFDVNGVITNRYGCEFSGRFRGEYDKVDDFLGLSSDAGLLDVITGDNQYMYQNSLITFNFKCDRPDDGITLTFNDTKSGSNKKTENLYKLTPDAIKSLSDVCKCKKYGAPVDVSKTNGNPVLAESDNVIYENKKVVKLTQSYITNIVKRVIKENKK